MRQTLRGTSLLLALLAGCATTSGGSGISSRVKQADQKFPPPNSEFSDDYERGFAQNINTHLQAGAMASNSGAMDQARAEWATAAQAMADFADKFPSSDWSVSFRYNAGKYFFYANQAAKAAEQADKVILSPDANPTSKAMAAKLAHAAATQVAQTKAAAGQLEPVRLTPWEQRKAMPLSPRPPPGEWKQVVEYADTYVKLADMDPDNKKPSKERFLPSPTSQVALSAAQIKYAFDNMEDARARFAHIFETWPAETDLGSVKLYLSTFLALNDTAGHDAALPRLKAQLSDAAAKATDATTKESLNKASEQLGLLDVEAAFNQARRMFDAGQNSQAAAAFEAFAAAHPTNPNVALALYSAALAHEKAGQLEKAAALRVQVMARFPDSKEAEASQPMLAALRAKQGKNDEAVKLYRGFIEKFPDSQYRCSSIFNLGQAYDQLRKATDAAASYVAYGTDARCAKESPNAAANVLFRAGELFDKAGKRADAKKAYQACADLAGVTDTVWKANQKEARQRAKR
jgi:tetratricopeptide (TPR) repeat protein